MYIFQIAMRYAYRLLRSCYQYLTSMTHNIKLCGINIRETSNTKYMHIYCTQYIIKINILSKS